MVQVRLLMDLLDEEAAVRQGQAHSAHRNSLPNAPHGHFAETIKANSLRPHHLLAPPLPALLRASRRINANSACAC